MFRITNISGGQLVCNLKDGTTLRLNNKQSANVSAGNITKYLRDIEKQRLVKIVDDTAKTAKNKTKEG